VLVPQDGASFDPTTQLLSIALPPTTTDTTCLRVLLGSAPGGHDYFQSNNVYTNYPRFTPTPMNTDATGTPTYRMAYFAPPHKSAPAGSTIYLRVETYSCPGSDVTTWTLRGASSTSFVTSPPPTQNVFATRMSAILALSGLVRGMATPFYNDSRPTPPSKGSTILYQLTKAITSINPPPNGTDRTKAALCTDFSLALQLLVEEQNLDGGRDALVNVGFTILRNGSTFAGGVTHTVLSVANDDQGGAHVLVDATFGLAPIVTSTGKWATAEDMHDATVSEAWSNISYSFTTPNTNVYAKMYYIDYPLLYNNVCAGVAGCASTLLVGRSVTDYATPITALPGAEPADFQVDICGTPDSANQPQALMVVGGAAGTGGALKVNGITQPYTTLTNTFDAGTEPLGLFAWGCSTESVPPGGGLSTPDDAVVYALERHAFQTWSQ
jgi:hypothetical protein